MEKSRKQFEISTFDRLRGSRGLPRIYFSPKFLDLFLALGVGKCHHLYKAPKYAIIQNRTLVFSSLLPPSPLPPSLAMCRYYKKSHASTLPSNIQDETHRASMGR